MNLKDLAAVFFIGLSEASYPTRQFRLRMPAQYKPSRHQTFSVGRGQTYM